MFITPYSQKNIDRPLPARRGISVVENKKSVSFTSLQSALDYIAEARASNPFKSWRDYVTLDKLDLNKIKDICDGLPTLQGWTAKVLKFVTNGFDSIMSQRGCIHQCSHCAVDSENKITTMQWDNFTALTDDISTLTKRLGYNPFHFDRTIYFFKDNDPMMYKSKGKDGILRNIFDMAKYYYEKTGTKTIVTTAGWPVGNKTSQKAAESFVEHPECLDNFCISVHPFHDYMQKSIKHAEAGEHEEAKIWRDKYVGMMANVIKSTIGLKDKIRTYGIILEYDESLLTKFELSDESAKDLFRDIFNKLNSEGIDVSYFRYTSDFRLGTIEKRAIRYFGRGAKYDSQPNRPMINNTNGIEECSKAIAPNGDILIYPSTESGCIKEMPHQSPFKFNFPFPTENHSKRPPPPLVQIRN